MMAANGTAIHPNEDEEAGDDATEVMETLYAAWINELNAPDLLPNRYDIVDGLLDVIQQIEGGVKEAKKGDFRAFVHKMEVERIRYVISDYLRCRLKKIEKFCFHVVDEDKTRERERLESKMSEPEKNFAHQYVDSLKQYFENGVLKEMPPRATFNSLNGQKIGYRPNLNHFVFVKVINKCDDIEVFDPLEEPGLPGGLITLEADSQCLLSYKSISDKLNTGDMKLI